MACRNPDSTDHLFESLPAGGIPICSGGRPLTRRGPLCYKPGVTDSSSQPSGTSPDSSSGGNGEDTASSFGRSLWSLFAFARPYRKRIAAGIACSAVARLFDLLPLVLVGQVVDTVTRTFQAGGQPPVREFAFYGLAVLATFIGLAFFQSFSNYALNVAAQDIRHDLRVTLYRHLQKLDLGFFENRQTGDVMAVVSNDVDNLESFFADTSTSMVRIVISGVGTYAFLFWLDWHLALLLLLPLPFVVGAIRFFAVKVQPQYRKARQAVGEVNAILENNIQGIAVIQAYTAESRQVERISRQSIEYRNASVAAALHRARFIPLLYVIAGFSFALLIGVGGWMTFTGIGPSLGDFTSFILMAYRLVFPLFLFGFIINQIQRAEASARRINELLDLKPKIVDQPHPLKLDRAPETIVFDRVDFAYPEREKVLADISFKIAQGQVLGVVGPTGAGKSTLVKLLLRYYDPGSGKILVNGQDLSRLRLADYRAHIGYVSQEAFLFFGTVAENIRLSMPEASHEQVVRSARIAGANEFIDRLPQGYDTMVGERGVKLSGGQRQRISLARAILRDPPLLILDEATSSVDTRTEELIQHNLHSFSSGRMTVAVAHRLSTIRKSDEILVFMDGRIAERGTHDSLLKQSGIYAGMWSVQSGET